MTFPKMSSRFKALGRGTLAGVLGTLLPALYINYMTQQVSQGAVLVGVAGSSLAGYAYGAYTISRAQEEANAALETASEDDEEDDNGSN